MSEAGYKLTYVGTPLPGHFEITTMLQAPTICGVDPTTCSGVFPSTVSVDKAKKMLVDSCVLYYDRVRDTAATKAFMLTRAK